MTIIDYWPSISVLILSLVAFFMNSTVLHIALRITPIVQYTVHAVSADVECWVRNDMMRYQMSEELLWLAGVGASVTDPSWNMTDIRMICRTSLSHNSWYVALVPVPTLIIHHIITLHIIMFQISNVSCSHHTHIQLSEINFGSIFVFYYYNV